MNDLTPSTMTRNNAQPVTTPGTWLRQEIGRLFEDFEGPARSVFNFGLRGLAPVPALEMVKDGKGYSLTVELPGMDEKDVDISVADGVLTVSGENKEEDDRKEDGYIISERRYGAFTRKVALPADADPDDIKAKFKRGVLKINIARDSDAAPQARKIEIEAE
jgi:HSP20 family protein